MSNVLDPMPTWAIMLISAVLIFVTSEAGFRFGQRKGPKADGSDPSTILEASAFTLLALLVGFSFSMALGRYDSRRAALLREANAISTTFLRAALLDDKTASAERSDLQAYIAQRIAFARADAKPEQRATAEANSFHIQRDMWSTARQAARRDVRSTMVPLFVAALNDTINLSTEERAVLTNHIPDVVILWLLVIALIAAGMLGYGFGRDGKRAPVFKAFFAVMIALVFGLVLDLDRPQRGIIRVSLAPLVTAQQAMEATSSQTNRK